MFNSILASVHQIPELLLASDDPKQISSNDFWGGTLAVHKAMELACRTAEKPLSPATPTHVDFQMQAPRICILPCLLWWWFSLLKGLLFCTACCVCALHACSVQGSQKRALDSLGTGVKKGCKLHCEFWEPNPQASAREQGPFIYTYTYCI